MSTMKSGFFLPMVGLFFAAFLYWIAAVVVLLLRMTIPEFRSLTEYGGRVCSSLSKGSSGPQGKSGAVISENAKQQKRKGYFLILVKGLQVLGNSILGRTRVSRKGGFSAFYATGLITCFLLFCTSGSTPCGEVAALSVRAHMLNETNVTLIIKGHDEASPDGFSSRKGFASSRKRLRGQAVQAQLHEERVRAERWSDFLGNHRNVRQSPFAFEGKLRNESIALQATAWFEEDLVACEAYVAPLSTAEWMPLLAFALHCLIRLLECLVVQKFRGGGEDTMTLFAAVSGCAFYVVAAVSCSMNLFRAYRQWDAVVAFATGGLFAGLPERRSGGDMAFSGGGEGGSGTVAAAAAGYAVGPPLPPRFSRLVTMQIPIQSRIFLDKEHPSLLQATVERLASISPYHVPFVCCVVLFVLHLVVQAVQAAHHDVLARLRRLGPGAQVQAPLYTRTEMLLERLRRDVAPYVGVSERVAQRHDSSDTKLILRRGAGVDMAGILSGSVGKEEAHPERPTSSEAGVPDSVPTSSVVADASTMRRRVTEKEEREGHDGNNSDGGYVPQRHRQLPIAPTTDLMTDRRVWEYHFPYTMLFQWVLEPHYLCEMLMYVMNLGMIVVLVAYGYGSPAATFKDAQYLPAVLLPTTGLQSVVVLQIATACGVLAFTVFNLSITASEHRAFWTYLNDTREVLLLLAQAKIGTAPPLYPDSGEDEDGQDASLLEVVDADKEVQEARYQRDLQRLLRCELVPEWNLIVRIW